MTGQSEELVVSIRTVTLTPCVKGTFTLSLRKFDILLKTSENRSIFRTYLKFLYTFS